MSDLRARAWDVAAAVEDPELPVLTLGDLGVLRDVAVQPGGQVRVDITPTYSGCPAMATIALDVHTALARAGIDGAVRTVLAPAWTTDWISADGHRKLREAGIAPPVRGEAVCCPLCGSAHVERLAEFGSTACKALWRCLDCREPFDRFKCH